MQNSAEISSCRVLAVVADLRKVCLGLPPFRDDSKHSRRTRLLLRGTTCWQQLMR